MNDEPTAQLPNGEPDPAPQDPGPQEPAAKRLTRPRDERVIAGVCAGIARYFRIDPVITRIAAVGLVFIGGVGIVLYLAAWLLVPEDGSEDDPSTQTPRRVSRAAIIGGAVLLFIALGIGADHLFWWPGWFGGPLVILAVFGAAIWWLVRGRRGAGAASMAGRVALGIAVLIASLAAVGIGFWTAGLGGGAAVAGLLVVAGLGIMAAAFAGGARWLVAPAIALALGTGIATAADVDLRGDYGERTETPRTVADLPESYDMGAGSLVVDLRNVAFPAGETTLKVEVGLGEAVLVVPPSLCVVPDAHVGAGEMAILGRHQDGVDLDRRDTALATDHRLAVDATVGIGSLRITTDPDEAYRDHDRWDRDDDDDEDIAAADRANAACIAGTQG
ncbi:MAG: PspC domain-containing protein [Thermoleophilia bacterium]|nr:PspC domain-containing protein [Thermoleophilia bacterium]